MLRRLLTISWILVVIIVLSPMIVLYIALSRFFDQQSLQNIVLPQSYESATTLIAEQFAANPSETDLYIDRVRQILPATNYIEIFWPVLKDLSDKILGSDQKSPLVIDLTSVKKYFKDNIEEIVERTPQCNATDDGHSEFRLCKPTTLKTNTPDTELKSILADAIDKEIPSSLPLSETMRTDGFHMADIQRVLPMLFGGVVVIGLLILIALTGLHLGRIVTYIGGLVFGTGAFLALIVLSFARLPQAAQVFEGLSRGQIEFIKFLATDVLRVSAMVGGVVAVVGAVVMCTGIFAFSHHSPQKKDVV